MSKQVVIVAHSGRMLANSARQSNWVPFVIDNFGDQEIAHLAQKNWVVPDFSKASLEPIITTIKQDFDVDQLVYGSGFEFHLETLFWLSEHFTVLGNTSVTFQQVQDKVFFFATLQRLQIPFLETHFTAPPRGTNEWLIKPIAGEGGAGIQWYDSQESGEGTVYWQRYQKGRVGSVLFVTDRESVQIIGFNSQWVESGQTSYPFVFSGVRHCPIAGVRYGQQLLDWLNQIVGAFSLVGLNSLDFIMNKGQLWILEINPRPSASLMLYDGYGHNKLFERHVQGCLGHLMDISVPSIDNHRGYQVLYAYYELVIPEQVEWPDWVLDKPSVGVIIPINGPICSIIAAEQNTERLTDLLNHRARVVYQLLIYKEKVLSCNFMPVLIN